MTGGGVDGGVPRHPDTSIEVGVFGGTGLYALLDGAQPVAVDTPYGPPSAPVVVGEVGGRRVGFLPRHGVDHTLPPHRIPYRANVWAMKHLGASDVILPCAAGSLVPGIGPGALVVADQLVDRTSGRAQTFYDGPRTVHVSLADPYDEEMRLVALEQARALGMDVHDGGTVVVVDGPRFSTRAESRSYAAQGWSVINMTAHPEAALCRELEMAAVNLSLITDHDVGVADDPAVAPVTHAEVLATFAANLEALRALILAMVPALPMSPDRPALRALRDATG
jgi:5'-methylthioadenosine phosphorylase